MINWRKLKVNDKLIYHVDEFDCVRPIDYDATVTKVESDHIIAECEGMNLWIDDFNSDMFFIAREI